MPDCEGVSRVFEVATDRSDRPPLQFVSLSRWSQGRLLHRHRHPAAG